MSKKQTKKATEFKVKDLVFARVRGYPPWPARIMEVGSKYKVSFFGTGETGMIKDEDLFTYEDNRESFKKKFSKRKNYQESLNEITKAWNRKKDAEIPLPKVKQDSETEPDKAELENSDVQNNEKIKSVPEVKNNVDIPEKVSEDQNLVESDLKIETKTAPKAKKEPKRSNNASANSPPTKRRKVEPTKAEDIKLDYDYLEATSMKIKRADIVYQTYTTSTLAKIQAKDTILLEDTDNLKESDCEFLDDHSVVILYEPLIHPVGFGLHITKHRPDEFDNIIDRLKWEAGVIQDVFDILTDLRKENKSIQTLVDNYFLDLTDFEELIGTVKIILEKDDLDENKRQVLVKELSILKIVLAIREYVPVEIKDETTLIKAHVLLKKIKDEYTIDYFTAMKHPVIVECFFKLTKYVCKQNLDSPEIVEKIRDEAQLIMDSIQENVKHTNEDYKESFWKTYLSSMKSFRYAISSVSRFDFTAITSIEEYESLLSKNTDAKNEEENESNQTDEDIPENMMQL